SHRLLTGLVAIAFNAAALVSAPAQPIPIRGAAASVHDANALAARIRAYHRGPGIWLSAGPPPPGYCATMSAGEFVLKNLVVQANAAVVDRQSGLARNLASVADRLSDELDEEEAINRVAGFSYAEYPCPAATPAPVARATVLGPIGRRAPSCRRQADARLMWVNARRTFLPDCLRLGFYSQSEPRCARRVTGMGRRAAIPPAAARQRAPAAHVPWLLWERLPDAAPRDNIAPLKRPLRMSGHDLRSQNQFGAASCVMPPKRIAHLFNGRWTA